MSDNFVKLVSRTTSIDTTSTVVTVTSVTAGNSLVAFLFDGSNSAPATHTVSDAQGSYTAQSSSQADGTNNVFGQAFVLANANAGSHTVTGLVTAGNSCWIAVVEVGSTAGAGAVSGSHSAFQSNPGTGANVLNSGSITISGAATVVSMAVDTSSAATSDEPTAGTSPFTFTSRQNNAVSVQGAYRIQTAAAAANGAATAGPVTGTHNFMIFGVAILNAPASGTATRLRFPWSGDSTPGVFSNSRTH